MIASLSMLTPRVATGCIALAAALAFSGCATIMYGLTQTLTVATDPPGAECTLERKGGDIAEIASTPAEIEIERSQFDLTIRCRKHGYFDATSKLTSDLSGPIFGATSIPSLASFAIGGAGAANPLVGVVPGAVSSGLGVIGVLGLLAPLALAVDLGTGALVEYPGNVSIRLVPKKFPTAVVRDTFFAQMHAGIDADAIALAARINDSCVRSRCARERAEADVITTLRRAELERLRTLTQIDRPS